MSLSLKDHLAVMPPTRQKRWWNKLSLAAQQSIVMGIAWWFHGRPEQHAPPGSWRFLLILAGRGWGKTRTGAEWVAEKARRYPGCRVALVAPTFGDGRDTMVEGESGLLSVLHSSELRGGTIEKAWNRTLGELFMANGSRFKIYSSEKPRQLRGPQHHFCHPAGTLVRTPAGQTPIEQLHVGDLVMTRRGPRPITRVSNRVAPSVLTLTHQHGELQVTPDHPVWVVGRGWTPSADVAIGHTLYLWNDDRDPKTEYGASTKSATVTATPTTPSSTGTAKSGSKTTAPSPTADTFTIATASPATTTQTIWNYLTRASTHVFTWPRPGPFNAATAKPTSKRRLMARPADTATPAEPADQQRQPVLAEHAPKTAAAGSRLLATASTAGNNLRRTGERGSAVSGVSTSERATRVYSLTVADQHEYFANNTLVHNCWGDEPAYWSDVEAGTSKDSTFSNLNFGLRLRPRLGWDDNFRPQTVLTTTPRRVPLLTMPAALVKARPEVAGLMQRPDTVIVHGRTMDNISNLDDSYRQSVIEPLIGTMLGTQELDGIMLEDVQGALWASTQINEDRLLEAPKLDRVIVGFDPSGGAGYGHDEHGVIVAGTAGVRAGQQFYILDDRSGNLTPNDAARRAIYAYLEYNAVSIVYEKNQGQDWIPAVFQAEWDVLTRGVGRTKPLLPDYAGQPMPRLNQVTAVKNKKQRATPVAGLYSQHRVHHVGMFPILENQMTTWVPEDKLESPDRMDALVWAVTWLYSEGPGVADVASQARRESRRGGRKAGMPSSRMPVVYDARRSGRPR